MRYFCTLVLFLFLPLTSAAATPIAGCGDVLSEPGQYRLTTDLSCPGSSGFLGAITVFSADVTLNLDGHSITCSSQDGLPNTGITVFPGVTNLTIRNGHISGCDVGVFLAGTEQSQLIDLNVSDNYFDPILGDGGFGIVLSNGTDNKFKGNIANGNEFAGLIVVSGGGNEVVGNVANENGVMPLSAGIGIIVRGNTTNQNEFDGITVLGRVDIGGSIPAGNLIQGNTALGNFDDDLSEHLFDINSIPTDIVDGECKNNWKGNTFVSQEGPTPCIE